MDDPAQDLGRQRLALEYAPAPRRRAWAVRKWLFVAGAVLLLYLTAEYGPPLARQARIHYVQSKVAAFEHPAGAVIYDSTPGASPRSGDEVWLNDQSVWPAKAVARREPACWSSLKDILFSGQQFWPPGTPAPKALVHRLRNARGQERLVAIIIAPPGPQQKAARTVGAGDGGIGLVAAVVAPAGWGAEPAWLGNSEFFSPGFDPAKPVKFFAGRVDPADPSRFSIPFELEGKPGEVVGRFDDDGEVRMKVKGTE